MAPSLVLLHGIVEICFEEEDGEAAAMAAEKNKGAVAAAASFQSRLDSVISFLGSLRPDALLHQAPKTSTLRLLSSRPRRDVAPDVPLSAFVACADMGMLVLYGGNYAGPGTPEEGCYLIYDCAVDSTLMSTVPPVPVSQFLTAFTDGPVALRSHPPSSSYVLAELATTSQHGIPDVELYLWRSDSLTPQWEMRVVRLPLEVSTVPDDQYNFLPDVSFSFGTSSLCWVDVLRGIIVYHLDQPAQGSQFRFIPLPEDGRPGSGISKYLYRPRTQESRTAACVAGVIKLVVLEGYLEGWDVHQFRFVTWTLTPDLSRWEKDAVFHVKDIWASDKYLALNIPQHIMPICPVLSLLEDGVVYVVVNDVEVHNIVKGFGVAETKVNIKGQYVLGLDMQGNRIIDINGGRPSYRFVDLTPSLLAIDFCACLLQGPKDRHERDENASDDVVERGKRPKVY